MLSVSSKSRAQDQKSYGFKQLSDNAVGNVTVALHVYMFPCLHVTFTNKYCVPSDVQRHDEDLAYGSTVKVVNKAGGRLRGGRKHCR